MCKAHIKVTHIKQQIYFYHLKGRGYNMNSDPVPDMDSDHFSTSLTSADEGILGNLLAFCTQLPASFYDAW